MILFLDSFLSQTLLKQGFAHVRLQLCKHRQLFIIWSFTFFSPIIFIFWSTVYVQKLTFLACRIYIPWKRPQGPNQSGKLASLLQMTRNPLLQLSKLYIIYISDLASERNSVVVGSNPTQTNFYSYFYKFFSGWWILSASVHSAKLM